jgi:hypothetical protein
MQNTIILLGITIPEIVDIGYYLCYNVNNNKSSRSRDVVNLTKVRF